MSEINDGSMSDTTEIPVKVSIPQTLDAIPSLEKLQDLFLGRLEHYGVSYSLVAFGLALLYISLFLAAGRQLSDSQVWAFITAATALAFAGALVAIYTTKEGDESITDLLKTHSSERVEQFKTVSQERVETVKLAKEPKHPS